MLYIISGPPRAGKTYWVTKQINKLLKEAKKNKEKGKPFRKVFSNFPVITPWGSSLIWKPDMVHDEIVDSDIFIDEAYQFYNSRNYKTFTTSDHLFFSLNGHNGNNIYLIAHSPNRLDTVIREMVNEFIFIKKVSIPFINLPLWFRAETFLDELAISQRYITKNACYAVEHYLFNKSIANTYNTHFFRKEGELQSFESWEDIPEYENNLLSEEFRKTPAAVLYFKVLYFRLKTLMDRLYKFISPAVKRIKPYVEPLVKRVISKSTYLDNLFQKYYSLSDLERSKLIKMYVTVIILAFILSRFF